MPTMRLMTNGPRRPVIFAELSVVSLVHDVTTDGGVLPMGSSGTVVAAYRAGNGYEVEFDKPFHAVVTLHATDLAA